MPRRILLTLILAACACWAGRVLAAPPVIPEEVRLRARQKVDGGYVPGLVICMVNADGRSYFSYGNLSQAPGSPPTDEMALYEIASVTKTFTGVLLAQMVVAGDVSLGDTVGSLMPVGSGMPGNGGDAITLEQLANHSSGLPSTPPNLPATITDFNNQFENYGADLLYEFLDSFTLPRAPGSGFEYSNAAVGLLGHILAQSQGTDYQTLLRERVLDPLGMSDTAIDLTAGQQIRRAPGHHGVVERPPFEMNSLGAAGGLKSSAADLGNFLESNLGIGEDVLDGALPLSHQRSFNLPSGPYDLGLGWWLWDGGDLVQHGGDSFGSTAFIGFRRSTGTGVAILSNNRSHMPAGISDLGFHCLDTNEPLDAVPATTPVAESDLRRMVGDYGVLQIESLYGRPVLF
ncbi:MAG: serine hydrolase domain-containing protein, partial [Verrucomicrobiales bacterium]